MAFPFLMMWGNISVHISREKRPSGLLNFTKPSDFSAGIAQVKLQLLLGAAAPWQGADSHAPFFSSPPFRSKMGLDKEPGLIHLETSISEGRE